jgi:hypothetical protein
MTERKPRGLHDPFDDGPFKGLTLYEARRKEFAENWPLRSIVSEEMTRPNKLRRWLKRIGITLAVIVGIVVAVPIIWILWTEFPKLRDFLVVIGGLVVVIWIIRDMINSHATSRAYEEKRKADDLERRFDGVHKHLNRIEEKLERLERRSWS